MSRANDLGPVYGAGRVLRQAPQQRVLYSPESASPKLRSFSGRQSPQLQASPNLSFASAASPQLSTNSSIPMAIPLTTPSSSILQSQYQNLSYRRQESSIGSNNFGVGVAGVDLLSRITMALKSGLESEINWALTALIQVSYSSPDALRLKSQMNLVHALLDRVSKSKILNDSINYDFSRALQESEKDFLELQKVLEALLILRNTSLDPENAQVLAGSSQCLEVIAQGLKLPISEDFSEFRNYCIEIAGSVSFYLNLASAEDPLYSSLSLLLSTSEDRGLIIPALRCLARLMIRDEVNLAKSLSRQQISKIMSYLLVDDEDLISTTLDFLYQYTSKSVNVRSLATDQLSFELATRHLVRLLTTPGDEPQLDFIRLPRLTRKPVPANPPPLSDEIFNELQRFTEPDRATNWIRSSYEQDSEAEVTQISLWKAYEAQFVSHAKLGKPLLPAVDFIKNVTSAFQSSAAMVVNLPDGQRRFIIKGIKPREFAIAPSVLNAPVPVVPTASERRNQRPAASYGVTASLVLQNIARTKYGRQRLLGSIPELARAASLNTALIPYVDTLLEIITGEFKDEEDEKET